MPCTLHKSSHVVFTIMLSRLQYYSHFTDGKTSFARVSSLPEATVHKRCRNSACRVCKLYHFVQLRERGREKGLDGGVGGGWMEGVIWGKAGLEEKSSKVSYICWLSTEKYLYTLTHNYLFK